MEDCNNCINLDRCSICTNQFYYKEQKQKVKKPRKCKRAGHDTEVSALYLHANSGATGWKQNDLTRGILSVECKETAKKSYTIKQEELFKCIKHASEQMQMPTLVFRFKDDQQMYAIVKYEDLLGLTEVKL